MPAPSKMLVGPTADHDTKDTAEARLRAMLDMAAERRASVVAADLSELMLARAIHEHLEQNPSSAGELADRLDLRESTVDELRNLERGRLTGLNLDGTVPSITHHRIRELAEECGPVSRVIGHVSNWRVLHESGLGLRPFHRQSQYSGPYIFCEEMLMRFGEYAWAQIEGVSYGYGGMGPTYAHDALVRAGLSEQAADAVFVRNGINYLIGEDGSVREKDFEQPPPSMPKLMPDGSLVAIIHGDKYGDSGEKRLRKWIDYLDSHDITTLWDDGPRHVSLYPTKTAAECDGFTDPYEGVAQLVVEQGGLQLWLVEIVEKDPSVWIPRQFRRYLEILGVAREAESMMALDDASPFQRWRASHAHRRPPVIELAEGPVTRFPNLEQES